MRRPLLKSGVALSIGALILSLCVSFLSSFQSIQLRLSNALYSERETSSEIVIVALDGDFLSDFTGLTTYKKRDYFSEAIGLVEEGNPSVVMLDWLLDKPSDGVISEDIYSIATSYPNVSDFSAEILEFLGDVHPTDERLLSLFETYDNIYLSKMATGFLKLEDGVSFYSGTSGPMSLFEDVTHTGFSNAETPSGYNIQSVYGIPAAINIDGATEAHMDIKLAEAHLGQEVDVPSINGQMLINYAAPSNYYPSVSIADVLHGNVDSSLFTNKIVLIGPTAVEFQDLQYTPIDPTLPMPGIEIHANAIQTILDEAFLVNQGTLDFALVLGVLILVSVLVFVHAPVLVGGVMLVLELIAFPFYAQWRFDHGVIVNLIWPVFALVAAYLAVLVYRNFTEFAEKRKLKEAFGRYVSPELVAQISEHPEQLKLGGERRAITALFLDIENFTNLSESLEPQAVVSVINTYFDALSKVIMQKGGTVDKFEGDAIMALFGAPVPSEDHGLKGCETALAIREKMAELNASTGYKLNIRIGLATGDAIVGNMGSENRFDYTAMGDTVNTASRLEGANKFYSTRILVTEGTYEAAKGQFFMRQVDLVCLKGKDKAIRIYEVLGPLAGATEEGHKVVVEWDKALEAYRAGRFDEAEKGFRAVLTTLPEDGPSKTLLGRVATLKLASLTDWDGVWKFESK